MTSGTESNARPLTSRLEQAERQTRALRDSVLILAVALLVITCLLFIPEARWILGAALWAVGILFAVLTLIAGVMWALCRFDRSAPASVSATLVGHHDMPLATASAVSIAGSWLAGIAGAFLVWNYMYAIGSRVIPDETYEQLEDTVTGCGGVAGGLFALATVLWLRRPAPGVVATGHVLATVGGFLGGSADWRAGLGGYFGTLVAFVIWVAFLAWRRHVDQRLLHSPAGPGQSFPR